MRSRERERDQEREREREEEEEEEGIEQGAAKLAQGECHTATFLRTTRIGERESVSGGWLAVEWRERGLGSGVEREVLSPIYHR